MPRLIVTASAAAGLEDCRQFLYQHNPLAMPHAAQVIEQYLLRLESEPQMGKLCFDSQELRELIIPFGSSGYVGLYRYVENEDSLYLLAFRHQKQAGY